jgi:superfamily II DNA/RNA helicase
LEFTELNLHAELLEGILSMNYKTATPIQEQSIPIILSGSDLIGIAQTGTGKTAAFVLPILNMIMDKPDHGKTQALIIVPTRELALQIDQAVEAYSYFTGTSSVAIYGGGDGQDFSQEKQAIMRGVDIIIATPGRLISHMNVGHVDFSQLRFLILDEADRMLDMGFQPDLFRIIRAVNEDRQTLMFSATMPQGIAQLAKTFMREPKQVSIAISKPAEKVKQGAYIVHDTQKLALMLHILKDEARKDQCIIVFCSRKHSVSALHRKLVQSGVMADRISSDLEQDQREEVMRKFRNKQINVLVATDVISRGIDVDGIDMVVNYDVPRDAEDYVHRIGRTARAQRSGEALTLVSPEDMRGFKRIEKLIEKEIDKLPLPEFLGPAPQITDAPPPKRDGHRGGKKPFFKRRKPQ